MTVHARDATELQSATTASLATQPMEVPLPPCPSTNLRQVPRIGRTIGVGASVSARAAGNDDGPKKRTTSEQWHGWYTTVDHTTVQHVALG